MDAKLIHCKHRFRSQRKNRKEVKVGQGITDPQKHRRDISKILSK